MQEYTLTAAVLCRYRRIFKYHLYIFFFYHVSHPSASISLGEERRVGRESGDKGVMGGGKCLGERAI